MSISWEQTSYNPNDQRECHKAGGTEHQWHLNYRKRNNQTQSLNGSGTYKPESDQAVRSITLQDIKIENQNKRHPRDAIRQIGTIGNYGTKSLILSPNKFQERKEKPSIN